MPTPVLPMAPHSTQAEKTVLGALLIDPDAIFTVAPNLQPHDFYDPTYKAIFAAMLQLLEEGTPVDIVTVSNQLQHRPDVERLGGSGFLAELVSSVPTSSHITKYADIVLQHSRKRQLAVTGKNIADLAHDDAKTADELMEMAERAFLRISRTTKRDGPAFLADMRDERYDHYVAQHERDGPDPDAVCTGYRPLDALLTSLAPGQLIVLAGRPGMGKSAMAVDIARHVALEQGKVVSIVSLEMSKEEVYDRIFAAHVGIPAWKLAKGEFDETQFADMGKAFDQLMQYQLSIIDDSNSDLVNIRSHARRHQIQHGLDLLIVDYLQLIDVTERGQSENANQRITYISKSLKRLARELHCPILALSQLSRECERRADKRPQLHVFRDSGSIEQDGDRILMLYREGEYDEDCDDPDRTELFVRKNRHGPTGHVELTFDRERMTFRQLSQENKLALSAKN